jgi:dihydropyrimidinase
MFGLWPRKGTVAVGSDGDLVIWDPEKEVTLSTKTMHMRVDYNPYEGRKVKGAPAVVLSRGDVIVDHGEFKGRQGRGPVREAPAGTAARTVANRQEDGHATPGTRLSPSLRRARVSCCSGRRWRRPR